MKVDKKCTSPFVPNGSSQNVYSYAYDRFGNRSSKTVNGEVSTYEYDLNNRLIAVHSGNAGTYYNYDNNGNQILSRSFELTDGQESKVSGITDYSDYKIYDYDLFNRLVNYNNGEEDSCSYTYHSDGLRKSKTINGATTSYSWNNGNLALETDASGTTIYEYDLQGVSRRIKNGSSDYYVKNAHGDVTGLYNRSGAAVNTYDYDAFGNHLTNNETDTNPFRYCGEYFDAETNNIYLRNRYYDTASGRFITEDPIKDGLNWYVYCGNNPIAFVDPLGLSFDEIIDALDELYNAKATMIRSKQGSKNYNKAYEKALIAKNTIRNSTEYIEDWEGINSIISPLVIGDNNSLQSIGDMKVAVEEAKENNENSHLLTDATYYGAFVAGAVVVKAGASAAIAKASTTVGPVISGIDPNKINHIFNKAEHNLEPLLQKFGGNSTNAYTAVYNAAQSMVESQKLTGVFDSVKNPIIVNIDGTSVYVGGNVIDGILKIGTFYIK